MVYWWNESSWYIIRETAGKAQIARLEGFKRKRVVFTWPLLALDDVGQD